MSPRIIALTAAVEIIHRCAAQHLASVPGVEMLGETTVWEGVVEVFQIFAHPKAKRCYAWSYTKDKQTQYVTVLEIPPVTDAITAVRASIMAGGQDSVSPATSVASP